MGDEQERSMSWVPGCDDFYSIRGLHQIPSRDCDDELTTSEHEANEFEAHYAAPARRAALEGIEFAPCDEECFPLGDVRRKAIFDLGYMLDCGLDGADLPPGPALDRLLALRRWCLGLVAFYSSTPLDKDIISDKSKLWTTIAVLGEMQSAAQPRT